MGMNWIINSSVAESRRQCEFHACTYFWPVSWLVWTDRANEGRCRDRCIEGRSSPSRRGPSERTRARAALVRWPFSEKKSRQSIHFCPELSTFTLSDRKSDDDNKTQRMIVYRAWLKGFCQVWWILFLLLLTTSATTCLQRHTTWSIDFIQSLCLGHLAPPKIRYSK